MSAETILKMIEEVSPDDTAKLDEIDARVWCYLNAETAPHTFLGLKKDQSAYEYVYDDSFYNAEPQCGVYDVPEHPSYTRSRDALKAIRPEGWHIREGGQWVTTGERYCQMWKSQEAQVFTEAMPTEELAELHAIIQAIAYERSENDTTSN
jgi:hypothetical protein